MPQNSSFKSRTVQLSLFLLFLLTVFGTAVLAQTQQTTQPVAPSGPVVYTPVGGEPKKRHPRGAYAYTPVSGITVMSSPDPDNNDPAPETTPTPGTDSTFTSNHHKKAVFPKRRFKSNVNAPATIKAGDPFVLVITTGTTDSTGKVTPAAYSEHLEWDGLTSSSRKNIFDPFVTLKLYLQDGTPVGGINQASDSKLHSRLRLVSGESTHFLPLYGRYFATKDLSKGGSPLAAGSKYVLHVFRHLAYAGSDADQSIVITVN